MSVFIFKRNIDTHLAGFRSASADTVLESAVNATPVISQVADIAAHDKAKVIGLATSANLAVDLIPVMNMKTTKWSLTCCSRSRKFFVQQALAELRASALLPLDTTLVAELMRAAASNIVSL
jgi:hypothetical protein